MSPLRLYRPAVETIESRALLSAALSGSISGTYTTPPGTPDVGQAILLSGEGSVGPLGDVTANGVVQGVGYIAHGHATGAVTLSATAGNLTLELTGPTQRGSSPLPTHFHYTIADESGPFPSLRSSGDVTLTFQSGGAPKPGGPGHVTPTYVLAPSFRLKFER